VVIEMPDHRLLALSALDPQQDDGLIDELVANDPQFRALIAKSASGKRKPFPLGDVG
jgi:hypothetical protein